MVKPVYSLFDNFKIGSTANALHTIAGLTQLNPQTSHEANTRYRLDHKGWAITDIFGINKSFQVTGEVLAPGEDDGNDLIVSMEDKNGDEAVLYFEYVLGNTKYSGQVACDITTNGGESNNIITFSGTLYIYGEPTKTTING